MKYSYIFAYKFTNPALDIDNKVNTDRANMSFFMLYIINKTTSNRNL